MFNSLEPYSKKELWALWHEYKEDSRGQTRDGAQSHKDPPTVVLKTGAVVAYISGNYWPGQTWNKSQEMKSWNTINDDTSSVTLKEGQL